MMMITEKEKIAAIETEERARIERSIANGLTWSKLAAIRPIRK